MARNTSNKNKIKSIGDRLEAIKSLAGYVKTSPDLSRNIYNCLEDIKSYCNYIMSSIEKLGVYDEKYMSEEE